MKTKSLWFATAAAVVLTGMTMMTSCSKDDFELPEVIESEVYDEGRAEEVKAEVGTEGTKLSYESWIMVRGITRASFDNKVSVTLNNTLNTVNQVIEVTSWQMGEERTGISYKEGDVREDGFVTITDSILVYSVAFDNFSFNYELVYQVPVYDDGVTEQQMPYHRYENIVDKGGSLTDLDPLNDGDYVYARKLYQHVIEVTFGGKVYEVTANITLLRRLGSADEPYVVKSRLISYGASVVNDAVLSMLIVEQTWSDGRVEEKHYNVNLNAYVIEEALDEISISGYKNDLKILNSVVGEGKLRPRLQEDRFVTSFTCKQEYVVNYNYFTISLILAHDVATYDDGVSTFEFPTFEFVKITDETTFTFNNSSQDEQGAYDVYIFKHHIVAEFDELRPEGEAVTSVVVRK